MSDLKRRAYFVSQAIKDDSGNFIPCIATENESGYTKTDWNYGQDFAIAQQAVNSCNKDMGLTPLQASEIVVSSMGAQRAEKGEASFAR